MTNQTSIRFIILLLSIALYGNIKAQSFQDCQNAYPICELESYHISNMKGFGNLNETFNKSICINNNFRETNSYWMKWKIKKAGTMTFVIDPNNSPDDIDFILFEHQHIIT